MAVLTGHEPCGSSGHAPQARGRQEQGGGKAVWRAAALKGSFTAPNPVFFHSGELVVYFSAVAAWFSTGLICHPIKKQDTTGRTRSRSQKSLLCLSKDGEDEKKDDVR